MLCPQTKHRARPLSSIPFFMIQTKNFVFSLLLHSTGWTGCRFDTTSYFSRNVNHLQKPRSPWIWQLFISSLLFFESTFKERCGFPTKHVRKHHQVKITAAEKRGNHTTSIIGCISFRWTHGRTPRVCGAATCVWPWNIIPTRLEKSPEKIFQSKLMDVKKHQLKEGRTT